MDFDFWIGLLKIIGMLATGVFGALGLLTKYKEEATGKITKWGKTALAGIVLSVAFSLGVFLLETTKAKSDAAEAKKKADATAQALGEILSNAKTTVEQQRMNLERSNEIAKNMESSLEDQRSVLSGNERIIKGVTSTVEQQGVLLSQTGINLQETQRLIQPLFPIRINFSYNVELKGTNLEPFRSRLTAATASMPDEQSPYPLSSDNPLFPNHDREPYAYNLLTRTPSVTFFLVRHPHNPPLPENTQPDLSFELRPIFGEYAASHLGYSYFKEGIVNIRFPEMIINLSDCYSNNMIASRADITGSQLVIRVSPVTVSDGKDEWKPVAAKFDWLSFEMSGRQEIRFTEKQLKVFVIGEDRWYTFTFPRTQQELSKLYVP